ncbi:MAG TPA: hypothetical protein VLF21_03630 [Candidatus Saccharimonadales bacterium]|nr:hypothetical protein [Candidatus Saccharimonadales bacterium]
MRLVEILNPPIPEMFEDCRGRTQKRRWCANQALRYLQEARSHVELAERRGDPNGLAMTAADGLVTLAKQYLEQFDGELAAGILLRRWPRVLQIGSPNVQYFKSRHRILDKSIRRLRFNLFSPSEIVLTLAFGPQQPPPLSS